MYFIKIQILSADTLVGSLGEAFGQALMESKFKSRQSLLGGAGSAVSDLSLGYKRPKGCLAWAVRSVPTYPNIVSPALPVNANLGKSKSRESVDDSSLQYSLRIRLFSAQAPLSQMFLSMPSFSTYFFSCELVFVSP